MTELLIWSTILLRASAFVLAVTFAVRYYHKVPSWKGSAEGRHLMGFTILVACFMAYALMNALAAWVDDTIPNYEIDGGYVGRNVVGFLLYVAVNWYLYRRNRILTAALNE